MHLIKNKIARLSILLSLLNTGSIHSTSLHSSQVNSNGANVATAIKNLTYKNEYNPEYLKAINQYYDEIIINTQHNSSCHTHKLVDLTNNPKKHILAHFNSNKSVIRRIIDVLLLTITYKDCFVVELFFHAFSILLRAQEQPYPTTKPQRFFLWIYFSSVSLYIYTVVKSIGDDQNQLWLDSFISDLKKETKIIAKAQDLKRKSD